MRSIRLFLFVLLAAALTGCAGRYAAVVQTNPTPTEIADVVRLREQAKDAVVAGLKVIDDTGALIDKLPLSTEVKDRYDCGVIRVTGIDAPSPLVQKVCDPTGARPLPSMAAAPLTVAKEKLKALTTCPSLRATLTVALGAVDPLINALATSGQHALVFASGAIDVAFSFIRSFLERGGECSPS